MSGLHFKEITQDTVWRANQRGTSGSWKAGCSRLTKHGNSLATVEVGVTSGVDLRDNEGGSSRLDDELPVQVRE